MNIAEPIDKIVFVGETNILLSPVLETLENGSVSYKFG